MSRMFLTFCVATFSTVVVAQTDRDGNSMGSTQVQSEKRMALVIGNGAYASARLTNPVNDATDMSTALTRCGFSVTSVTNADKRAMRQGIRTFIEGLDRGSVALFYFAGHAVQSRGENYMIPVGADVKLEDEIPDECVSLTSILGSLENARTGINLIILDACRDNPFRGFKRSLERGLRVVDAPKDSESLIAYATAPGSVATDGTGRNGIYTTCLLKYLTTPNLSVETIFRQVRKDVKERTGGQQVPWVSLSMEREFFFVGRRSDVVVTIVTPDNKTQNIARLTLPNDGQYEGDVVNGQAEGKGSCVWPDGKKYIGTWKDNMRNGQGTLTLPSGGKYVGEFKDSKMNGHGTLTLPGGERYVGEWKDGKMNGQGALIFPSGEKYDGEWKDNNRNGRGALTWPDGRKYVGEFKDSKYNGQGTLTAPNGEKYVGEYKDGKFSGQGIYTWPSGQKYVGEYSDGKRNGQGTLTTSDGRVQGGNWVDDVFMGK